MKKLTGISILVVDDEPELRDVLRDELEDKGAIIYEAENGEAALEEFKRNRVDVIISDVRMSKCTGIDLLKNLRKEFPTFPVFFLCTGYSDTTQQEAQMLGANDLFFKPYKLDLVISKLLQDLSTLKRGDRK